MAGLDPAIQQSGTRSRGEHRGVALRDTPRLRVDRLSLWMAASRAAMTN